MSTETYKIPKHGWTCFHCGETFTQQGSAADHFGDAPYRDPGCLIRVQLGDERGLQMALRKAEVEIDRLRNLLESEIVRHETFSALLKSYLRGYRPFRDCETVRDVFFLYDSMEGRALAAEENSALL